jgi:tRNA(fMet)-specific endonuclease VapC
MSYFLDTSACIALLRNRPPVVRARANSVLDANHGLLVSSIVLHELWYGVYKSSSVQKNMQVLQDFLTGNVEAVDFDADDARAAGELRAELEMKGAMIGAYDTLIAAQCLRYNFILVTADVSDFRRVKDLRWENWAK